MTEYKNIKFKTNLPYVVRLKYDSPKEKTGEYGDYWIYGVEYESETYSFIANLNLHTMLSHYKKGTLLEIMKVEDDDKKSHFEVEVLSEKDIKSSDYDQPSGKTDYDKPDWDRINADKQNSIVLQVAMKLAVQSLPAKVKLGDKDYEEIETRMVKFNAIMSKYLSAVMPEQKAKFPPLIQAEYDKFDKYLNDNKDTMDPEVYKTSSEWLHGLKTPTVEKLVLNLFNLKEKLKPKEPAGEYKQYHESLITACCDTLKSKDRLPVIQTLTNIVKKWGIEGLDKLSETTENQCLDLLAAFDQQLKDEDEQDLPY